MGSIRTLALVGFLGLAGPGILLILWVNSVSRDLLERTIPVDHPTREIIEPVMIERGRHLAEHVLDCGGCHAADYGGHLVLKASLLGRFVAPNLTSGNGGIGEQLDTEAWDQAIRHGVGQDGQALLYHPARRYAALSDQDLESVIRYLKQVPPRDRDMLGSSPEPLFRLFLALGWITLDAHAIDHRARPPVPAAGPTGEYGRYLARIAGCFDCHGDDLAGRSSPRGAPDAPAIHSDALTGWTAADFDRAMRKGVTPEGRVLDAYMPWPAYKGLTEDEMAALWRFLKYTGGAPD